MCVECDGLRMVVTKVMEMKVAALKVIEVMKVLVWQRIGGGGLEYEWCRCAGWCE